MGFSDAFYSFCREKCTERGWQAKMVAQTGIPQGTLSKILTGVTKNPELPRVGAIIDALGEEFLLRLYSPKKQANPAIEYTTSQLPEPAQKKEEKMPEQTSLSVNVYSMAGAGPAIDYSEYEPLCTISLPTRMARKADMAYQIDGHSMEPLIPHKSIVGIKRDVPFVKDEIYAAYIPYEGVVIKRIGIDYVKSEFIFKSENPDKNRYPDFRLAISESDKIIIGRVVWIFMEP